MQKRWKSHNVVNSEFSLLNDRLREPHRDVWGSSGGFTGMYGGAVAGSSQRTQMKNAVLETKAPSNRKFNLNKKMRISESFLEE